MHNLGQIEKKTWNHFAKTKFEGDTTCQTFLTQHEFDIFLSDIFHLFLNC